MSVPGDIYRRIKAKTEYIKQNSAFTYIKSPVFTISGNNELVIQGIISVEEYGESLIVLRVGKMIVSAFGRGMSMCFFNRNTAKLTGYITSLTFDET